MNKYIILSALAGTLALSGSAFADNTATGVNSAVSKVAAIHGGTVTLRDGLRLTAASPQIIKGLHVGERVSVTYSDSNMILGYERA